MLNVRVHYKMATEGRAAPTRREGGMEVPSVQLNEYGRSSCRVWEPDQIPKVATSNAMTIPNGNPYSLSLSIPQPTR